MYYYVLKIVMYRLNLLLAITNFNSSGGPCGKTGTGSSEDKPVCSYWPSVYW